LERGQSGYLRFVVPIGDGCEAAAGEGGALHVRKQFLKVIGPLFLDDLRAELDKAVARRTNREATLLEFQAKLSRLTFFDPACGCGNFLVIAYREIRRLELECLKALYPTQQIDAVLLSRVTVDQYYGIEIEEFPARIAEVAMWMTDHLSNNEYNEAFQGNSARIPLRDSAHILHADALDTDWATLIAPDKCHYIMGNPPFIGQSFQTPAQREQMARIIDAPSKRAGSLDYVAAWFIKAGQFITANPHIRVAFVSTNSISQGEQVAQLWPTLFDRFGLEIAFAHRTFSWGSEARGAAHVHVVVIGLTHRKHEPAEKRLFSYPDIKGEPIESRHEALTPYLFDGQRVTDRHLVVRDSRSPLSDVTPMRMGSKIVDDGHYFFDHVQRRDFLEAEPEAAQFMVPAVGSQEYIRGESRWILNLTDVQPTDLRALPKVMERVRAVRAYRSVSKKEATRKLADFPTQFEVTTIPKGPYLAIPKVSGERRDYIPIGWLEPPALPTQLLQVVIDADRWIFGVLTSKMHMAWMAHVGGRFESRYQYSVGVVYNTFPWPDATPAQRGKIELLAQAVLDARGNHPTSSLADLYDPDTMPGDLRRAHHALDVAVDKLYRPTAFASDRDRVEHLFGLYEKLVNPAAHAAKRNAKTSRRTGVVIDTKGGALDS
jgi:hypothetical protein